MVNYLSDSLTPIFSALADPTRRAILEQLAHRESCVTELAEPFDISLPAISKHLRILENVGLLTREKEGRMYHCRLAPEPLQTAAEWIERYRAFWERQFDALADYLNESKEEEKRAWQKNQQVLKRPYKSEEHSRRRRKKSSKHGRKRKS